MRFQIPLLPARLIRRYKRFLADCQLDDGREITAHCANPGSMMGLAAPGTRVWLEPNDDPKKKLKFGWRLVEQEPGQFTVIDTGLANKVVGEALMSGTVPALRAYTKVQAEVKYGTSSRVDFLLTDPHLADAYVEVKSVTLSRQPGLAEFPDSVTKRGAKHLHELAEKARTGHRAIMLFLIQRTDCTALKIASDIDPDYWQAYLSARAAGVETMAFSADISTTEITLSAQPVDISALTSGG